MTEEVIALKPPKPKFTYIACPNCWGYGTKGNPPKRITCPSCGGKGILEVPAKEDLK